MVLHNPNSQAHLEELRARLTTQLVPLGQGGLEIEIDRIEHLVELVRDMDQGRVTSGQALEAFRSARVPGFSFGRWLVDMVEEGVYLDAVYDEAA